MAPSTLCVTEAPPAPPAQAPRTLGVGYMSSTALNVVLSLGVADRLAEGPQTVHDLAREAGANEDALYRVMRMRLKAKGHSASPRTALDILARIQRHRAKIAEHTVNGITTMTPEQLELFDTLKLPKPA